MGKKYVANAFHNRSLIDKNNGGGGGGSAALDFVSNTELKIGTLDGKDLYRCIFTGSGIASSISVSLNASKIISLSGFYDGYGASGYTYNSGTAGKGADFYGIKYDKNNKKISFIDNGIMAPYFEPAPYLIDVTYTKD